MTTTTQTQAPAPAVRGCPPSTVVDTIVPWEDVQDGDLVLWDGELRPVEWNVACTDAPPLRVVMLAGEGTATIPAGTYAAVRRYTEGAEITLTAGKARTAAAGLDEAADDRSNRAGTACRDCAESPQRYCEGCQDLLDTAGEYRVLRDELIRAAGSGEARGG